jgi:hypothetical protein
VTTVWCNAIDSSSFTPQLWSQKQHVIGNRLQNCDIRTRRTQLEVEDYTLLTVWN